MLVFYIYVHLVESCSNAEEEFSDPFWLRMNKQVSVLLKKNILIMGLLSQNLGDLSALDYQSLYSQFIK